MTGARETEVWTTRAHYRSKQSVPMERSRDACARRTQKYNIIDFSSSSYVRD